MIPAIEVFCKEFFKDEIEPLRWQGGCGIIRIDQHLALVKPMVSSLDQIYGFSVVVKTLAGVDLDKIEMPFDEYFPPLNANADSRGYRATRDPDSSYKWLRNVPAQVDIDSLVEQVIDFINMVTGS